MFFDKKEKTKCESCGSNVEKKFSFCPRCGNDLTDPRKEEKDFGFLGKSDLAENNSPFNQPQFGIFDKMLNSMLNNVIKSLDKQMKDQFNNQNNFGNANIKGLPNGIKVKISGPFDLSQGEFQKPKPKKKTIRKLNEQQTKKISKLPKTKAKTTVKRFDNKLVYELSTPGVTSIEDIFISKLETGYEVKAIGDKKVYINSVPINLPLSKYSILKNKLQVEFLTGHQEQQF